MPNPVSSPKTIGLAGVPALDVMDTATADDVDSTASRADSLQALLSRRAELLAEFDRTGLRIEELVGTPDPMDPAFTQALLEHCHRAKRKAIAAQAE